MGGSRLNSRGINMNGEINKCSDCGCVAKYYANQVGCYVVCPCCKQKVSADTKEKAVKKWNGKNKTVTHYTVGEALKLIESQNDSKLKKEKVDVDCKVEDLDAKAIENVIADGKKRRESKIVNAPSYYVTGRKFEPKDVIADWSLNFNLGNAVKYISRAGRKSKSKKVEDLEKAIVYLEFEINKLTKQ